MINGYLAYLPSNLLFLASGLTLFRTPVFITVAIAVCGIAVLFPFATRTDLTFDEGRYPSADQLTVIGILLGVLLLGLLIGETNLKNLPLHPAGIIVAGCFFFPVIRGLFALLTKAKELQE